MSYLIYPGTLALAVGLYATASDSREYITVSAFASIILGLTLIAIFEFLYPNRLAWRPRISDLKTDLLYIAIIQIAVPRLLGLLLAVMLAENVGDASPAAWIWPREWPLAAQVMLLIGCADFMRYWLHRFAHTMPLLWRLHAVHHSPDRLYWLNTSRFHPVEKVLHFSLDSLPFILMGVDAQVLGFWFVIYSVNGFFQHSNIDLRLGFLSGIFSTAEMHRWHHSRTPSESDTNYANIFILWDRLFGSYFRPRDRSVGELGLLNRDYPMGFVEQFKAPLIGGLDRQNAPVPTAGEMLRNMLVLGRMLVTRLTHWRRLMRAAAAPQSAQAEVLLNIVKRNAGTRYGREHGFENISSYEQFAKQVPVVSYEELRPYVDEQLHSGKPILTAEQPVIYNRTSGTTGQPKHVPVTPFELELQRRHAALLTYGQYAFDPLAFSGKIWAIASAAVEGRFENGTPWGSASGLLYASMSKHIAAKYVMPPAVFEVADPELKSLLMLRLALAQKDITYLTCANPSTLLKLCSMANQHWQGLVRDIEQGGFRWGAELPSRIMDGVRSRLHADPERAAELREIFERHQSATYAMLWPYLRLVSIWTSGNCAVAVSGVRALLPASASIVELGYLSSEFHGTLTIDCRAGTGLPTIRDYFFEFIEPEKWEAGDREFKLVHQLEPDRDYQVVITTPSGLYRYFINDIVRVTGRCSGTPTVRFLQKGKGVTNITGEKLYENHVTEALHQAERHFGLHVAFFMMLADVGRNAYELFLEVGANPAPADEIGRFIDAALAGLNVEYRSKRDSGRLSPPGVRFLDKGAGEAYRTYCVDAGQKDGQFKTVALQYAHECGFSLDPYLSVV
jgi:sterol desaturase/sphingolipid hydroxylase (fatty acid hydroxylase superfamily)